MTTAEVKAWRMIFGLENEHGCLVESNAVNPTETIMRATSFGPNFGNEQFLENGGRLYMDAGEHPEYATPECSTIAELIAASKAGRHILGVMSQVAETRLQTPVTILRNNVSVPNYSGMNATEFVPSSPGGDPDYTRAGSSWGQHENYSVPVSLAWAVLQSRLVSHLASRIVYCGAGTIIPYVPGMPPVFRLSQREPYMAAPMAPSSMGSSFMKPMIMSREEPHASSAVFRRVQVVCGDSLMADTALALEVGVTAIALRLIMADADPDIMLDFPIPALHQWSTAGNLTERVPTTAGELTALEVQWYWYYAAVRASSLLSADEMITMRRWGSVLWRLEHDVESCAKDVDWVAKRAIFRRLAYRDESVWRAMSADLAWHNVRSDRGLWARAGLKSIGSAREAQRAVMRPPRTTRAAVRGALLRELRHRAALWDAEWSSITIRRPMVISLKLMDPGESRWSEDALLAMKELKTHSYMLPLSWRWPSPDVSKVYDINAPLPKTEAAPAMDMVFG